MEQFLTAHHIPAVFAGAFLFGESVIITAAFLAAELNWRIEYVALAAFLGTVLADTFWFLCGGALRKYFSRVKFLAVQREKADDLIMQLTGSRPFLALLFIKFLYGSRIAMILYVAAKKTPFLTFVMYNTLGTVIWLAVFISIGYFAGRSVASTVNAVASGLTVFIVSAVVLKLLISWLTKKILGRHQATK